MPRRKYCYAVAKGKVPGIYFEWAETQKQVLGFSGAIFEGFSSMDSASLYLKGQGFEPVAKGGWMSKDRSPLLYTTLKSNNDHNTNDNHSNDHNRNDNKRGTNADEPIAIDSSSEGPGTPLATAASPTTLRQSTISIDGSPGSDQQSTSRKRARLTETQSPCPPSPTPPLETLDAIQQQAIDAAMQGKNIFLTGVAGTGKSFVTQKIVQNAKLMKKEVAVAAPTGVAAVNLNLGAQTVHSLAGVKVPQRYRDFGTMFSKVNSKKWRNIEVLVIDEVGMLTADFLDWLDVTTRQIRKNMLEPFGGIQLIFVGDFAQLGPVPGSISLRDRAYKPTDEGADCFLGIKECTAYAFQSVFWRQANFEHVHLKKVYRQSDIHFIEALMDLRESRAHSSLVDQLVSNCSPALEDRPDLEIPEGILPTVLYCTNWKVDKENYDKLKSLRTEYKQFQATDGVILDTDVPVFARHTVEDILMKNKFFEQCQASKNLDLKVGAQVMLLQNLVDQGLVNGSRGVIESFKLCPAAKNIHGVERLIGPDDGDKYPGRKFEDIKFGMKLEFEGFIWTIFKFTKMPYVKFMNNTSKIITPAPFERNMFRQGICRRQQVPLRLAWAITMHKSQGSTLDLVVCDLKGCFTTGQAYVALSRAKTMQGLQIKNFDPKCVSTDPLVEDFYKALDNNTMEKFLHERAGLWWYPILDSIEWLDMFQNASKNPMAKTAAAAFQDWVVEYKPLPGYTGWRGFTDSKTGLPPMTSRGTTAAMTPNPALTPTSYSKMKIEQKSIQSAATRLFFSPQVKSAVVATSTAAAASTTPSQAVTSSTQSTQSSPTSCGNPNNAALVAAFQELVTQYNKEQNYNAAATYRKVFQAIQNLDFEITKDNAKGLCKGQDKVPGIDDASADKIFEFATTGTIAKLEEKKAAAQEAS